MSIQTTIPFNTENIDLSKLNPLLVKPKPKFSAGIPQFISKYSLARTNRFVVNVFCPIPSFIGKYEDLEIESAEIPSLSLLTTEFQYDQTPKITVPYLRNPQRQITLSIRMDENHLFRKLINEWMEFIIITPRTGTPQVSSRFPTSQLLSPGLPVARYAKNYYNDYTGSIQIFQIGIDGKIKNTINIIGAYPINIDSIKYDWEESNNYIKMNTTFSYFEQLG